MPDRKLFPAPPTHQARRANHPASTRQMCNGETSGAGNGAEGGGGSRCAEDGGPALEAAPAGGRGEKRPWRRTGFGQGGQSSGTAVTGVGAHSVDSPRPSRKTMTRLCSASVLKRTTPCHNISTSVASAPERAWPRVNTLPTTSAMAATRPATANLGVRHASMQKCAIHEAARHWAKAALVSRRRQLYEPGFGASLGGDDFGRRFWGVAGEATVTRASGGVHGGIWTRRHCTRLE